MVGICPVAPGATRPNVALQSASAQAGWPGFNSGTTVSLPLVAAAGTAWLVLAPADVAWKSCALRTVFCDPRWAGSPTRTPARWGASVPNPARSSRGGRALELSRVTRVRGRGDRATRRHWPEQRASGVGGRRDAKHAAAARSRKARAAIPRGEFGPCDPRRSQQPARRISAPGMCRPHASLLAARAAGYEPRALSRRGIPCARKRTKVHENRSWFQQSCSRIASRGAARSTPQWPQSRPSAWVIRSVVFLRITGRRAARRARW